jgi:hypothetical protein
MMFSNGRWNCVLLPGTSGKRTIRAVRADGKEMQRWESPLRVPAAAPDVGDHAPHSS